MRTRFLPLLLIVGLLGAGACKSDKNDKNDKNEVSSAYCDSVATVFNYDTGGPDDGPDGIKATYTKALSDLRATFATLEKDGPAAGQSAARRIRAAFTTSSTRGVDTTDRQIPANSALVGAARAACGWANRRMSAANFAFSHVPGTLPAGRTGVVLRNDATDTAHLLLVIRVKDGVTKSTEELANEFRLPEEQQTDFDGFAGGAFAFPGSTANGLVDMKPGRYVYLCPIPLDEHNFGGPDHASQGMRGEITVA